MKSSVKLLTAAVVAGLLISNSTANAASSQPVFSRNITVQEKKSPAPFQVILRPTANSTKVRLFLIKPSGKRLLVRLYSPDGGQLTSFLTEKKAASVFRSINFNEAEEGVYKLFISDGNETVTREIVLKRRQTIVEPSLVIK